MCASTTAKLGALGWFLALVVGVPYLTNRYPGLVPEWVPSWVVLAVVAVGFVGGGFLLNGLDRWRWHRLAGSLGLEPADSGVAQIVDPTAPYRGAFEGRRVRLDHVGDQDDMASNWTRVAARHDADPDGPLVVRERGLGGVPESDFPPAVELQDAAFSERFEVYCEDEAFARDVLVGHVRELLLETDAVDELDVTDDTVVSKQALQQFDRDVISSHMRVATGVADAVETARGR